MPGAARFGAAVPKTSPRPLPRLAPWKEAPHRLALLALYAEVDALLAGYACDASTECCQFGVTGREPYPTAVELAEVTHAIVAAGFALPAPPRGRALPVVDETRRCPLLDARGRCRIYASRPFGCRTFFCGRATGPGKIPRADIQRVSRAIADLSARFAPRDPLARPLTAALASLRGR